MVNPALPPTRRCRRLCGSILEFDLYCRQSAHQGNSLMRNDWKFSALDRHAVLTGSDDGFRWHTSQMLALEAVRRAPAVGEIRRRCEADCEHGARWMVSEKIIAAFEAGASWLAGASLACLHHRPLCRRQRQAPHRRLIDRKCSCSIRLAAGRCYDLSDTIIRRECIVAIEGAAIAAGRNSS